MKIFYTVLSAVLAAAACALAATYIYIEYGFWYLLGYIALCLVCLPLSGYMHELGHVVFGAASGMKVTILKTHMFCSSACTVSPKRGGNMKKRYITTCSGGLVINFLLIAWGVIAFAVPQINPIFSFTLPSSLYLFMLNVLPAEYRSGKTDILCIVEAAKNQPTAQVLLEILEIQGEIAEGTPLEEIEEERLLNLPQLPDDDYTFAMLTDLRRRYYKAKGDKTQEDIYYMRLRDLGYDYKEFD